MSDAEARAALARLEAAGKRLRELPGATRLEAVGRIFDAWSDPGSPVRRRMLEAHPAGSGLGRETVAAGLALALAGWNASALEALVEAELGSLRALDDTAISGVTTVLHGGVIPMPTLIDALAPLALGSTVLSKPAARDPVTPRLVAASLESLAPELSGCLEVCDVRREETAAFETLLATDRVVVTGSDEAVDAVRSRIASHTRLVAHGHKLSVAMLGDRPQVDLVDAAQRLAVDVALWDQLGCLSPVACWTLGDRARAGTFAAALAGALAAREGAWPRGEIDPASAARIASERANAELRGAAGRSVTVHASAGTAWTVVAEADAAPRPAPLHRFVRVHPATDLPEVERALGPHGIHLTGVALEGFDRYDEAAIARALGASRTARFGELQAPPLDWARDGLGVLSRLLDPDRH